MKSDVKNNFYIFLETITGLVLIINLFLHFGEGYGIVRGVIASLIISLLTGIYYVLLLIYLVIVISLFIRKQRKFIFTILWLIFFVIGQIPKDFFFTLGALYSIYKVGPDIIADDARFLANEYPQGTCIGFPERFPCESPIPIDVLPLSIRNIYPVHVLILDEYILLEKAGLQGIFRGFVLFRNDSNDIWKGEKSVQLQADCNICWKIRIIENLYWYHETSNFQIDFFSIQE